MTGQSEIGKLFNGVPSTGGAGPRPPSGAAEEVATAGAGAVAAEVVAGLRARGLTVATAESLTGGLLGAALTSVPGASAVYRGGVVAYATELKHTLLGVDADHLARAGAVDGGTAAAMAAGVRVRAGADIGIATTGVAGPAAQDGHPAGTVHLGWADAGSASSVELALTGGRAEIRAATVAAALTLVRDRLPAPPPAGS